MYNPIEISCYYVVQPIIDYLSYLLNEVHYLAFLLAMSLLGICVGLVMGIISVVWYKYSRPEYKSKSKMSEAQGDGKYDEKIKFN